MSAAACSAFKRFWGSKQGVFKKKSLFRLHLLRQVTAMPTSKGGSKLQQLYDVAKDTFKDTVSPTEEQVQRIREAMSGVSLEELGLVQAAQAAAGKAKLQEYQERGRRNSADDLGPPSTSGSNSSNNSQTHLRPQITYLHVYEDQHFALGIFCLPASASIPLHNHPDMTVFSRVLYGSMHVKAYDWLTPEEEAEAERNTWPSTSGRRAKLAVDQVSDAVSEPLVLFPSSGGNIHTFTAVTGCAVLDLLAPPYAPPDDAGRDCTYYVEREAGGNGVVTHLEESHHDMHFGVVEQAYQGIRPHVHTHHGLHHSALPSSKGVA